MEKIISNNVKKNLKDFLQEKNINIYYKMKYFTHAKMGKKSFSFFFLLESNKSKIVIKRLIFAWYKAVPFQKVLLLYAPFMY